MNNLITFGKYNYSIDESLQNAAKRLINSKGVSDTKKRYLLKQMEEISFVLEGRIGY